MTPATDFYWHALHGDNDAALLRGWVDVLAERLRAADVGLDLHAAPLPADVGEAIVDALAYGDLNGCVEACRSAEVEIERRGVRVSVYCNPESAAARAARGRLPHALWGISIVGTLSLTYCQGNPFAFWHETLHLLGAQDHYSTDDLATTCELPSCVMQYAPSDRTVGERPFLCRRTRAILQKRAGRSRRGV